MAGHIFLLYKLTSAMKNNLNYFYHEKKVKLMMLSAMSLIFITFNLLYYVVISSKFLHYNFNIQLYINNFPIFFPIFELILW